MDGSPGPDGADRQPGEEPAAPSPTPAPAPPLASPSGSPAPPTIAPAAGEQDGSGGWWPWLLAALALAVVGGGLAGYRFRRRPRAAGG